MRYETTVEDIRHERREDPFSFGLHRQRPIGASDHSVLIKIRIHRAGRAEAEMLYEAAQRTGGRLSLRDLADILEGNGRRVDFRDFQEPPKPPRNSPGGYTYSNEFNADAQPAFDFTAFEEFIRNAMGGFPNGGGRASAPKPPPPRAGERAWWDVLGFDAFSVSKLKADEINARYKELAKQRHPDRGGTTAGMVELNKARDAARAYCGGR